MPKSVRSCLYKDYYITVDVYVNSFYTTSMLFSLLVKTSIMSKNSHVLSSLFCFNDVLTPLLITDISNETQLANRTVFEYKCKRKGDFLIQNSIYTQDNISTINITRTTECYARLPCAHCEQEIIEIRRGNHTNRWSRNKSMCSPGVSTLHSPVVDRSSNPGSGSAL